MNRTIGLWGAVGIGVGAIVGGGILALAGVAFSTAGPAAIVAFALNGVIAILTALSFSELASKFPESGGTYTYSKKTLTVEAAFAVGWIVWFASIVAAVLYALGFGHFMLMFAGSLLESNGHQVPAWMSSVWADRATALAGVAVVCLGLMFKTSGGGQWVNIGKVAVFGALILGGLVALFGQPIEVTTNHFKPFFVGGAAGLVQAMGYCFIALQGFDLIAAVGGEIKEPAKNLPRAMVLSLLIALAIYIPLLAVIVAVGVPEGQSIAEMATADPEGVVAIAARQFLGPFGFWLVIIAGVLSMFSALQANLLAASRIGMSMGRDRVLPARMGAVHAEWGTPRFSVLVTWLIVVAILTVLPDVAAAGAASSLIFLVTFATAHWLAMLVRKRSRTPAPYQTPLYPLVPVVGGLSCLGLAVFQGVSVPAAGNITIAWLGVGGILFLALFANRARVRDAAMIAHDPELLSLRGRNPLVLVPVANPETVEGIVSLADALVPTGFGRVLLHHVVPLSHEQDRADPKATLATVDRSTSIVRKLIQMTVQSQVSSEVLVTSSDRPWNEIARVARLYRCDSVVMGMGPFLDEGVVTRQEALMAQLRSDVVLLRAKPQWQLSSVRSVLVPVAGRGGHEHLLARLLASLSRVHQVEIQLVRVLHESASREERRLALRELRRLAEDVVSYEVVMDVVATGESAGEVVAERAKTVDLVVMGVQRVERRRKIIGSFARTLAEQVDTPIVLLSSRD